MESNSLLCADKEFAELYQRNQNLAYRLCYLYLRNHADAEDAVQSIFLKLLQSNVVFNDINHEKAWFIITTKNHCKNVLKSWWSTRRVNFDTLPEIPYWDSDTEPGEVIAKLFALPAKYKTVLYLFYVEDYSVKEIAEILNRNESTIKTQLSRGRERLKIDLGGNQNERMAKN